MQTLFLSLYKSFSSILTERLPVASSVQTVQDLKSINPADANAMDIEEPSAMDMDNEDSRPEKRYFFGQEDNDPMSFSAKFPIHDCSKLLQSQLCMPHVFFILQSIEW